jgi:hypothetical protein
MSKNIKDLLNQAQLNEDESSISSAEKTFSDEADAAQIFSILKTKILSIDEWNEHALLSEYGLFDENGAIRQTKILSVGVFMRISMTGSGKYDWIKIINIRETADELVITVKPTFDPTAEKPDKNIISHFFTDESTNNFCLLRETKTVSLSVIGLNEKQNTSETKNALETIRNVAVNLGVYLGMQKSEWEKFCRHLLEDAASEADKTK